MSKDYFWLFETFNTSLKHQIIAIISCYKFLDLVCRTTKHWIFPEWLVWGFLYLSQFMHFFSACGLPWFMIPGRIETFQDFAINLTSTVGLKMAIYLTIVTWLNGIYLTVYTPHSSFTLCIVPPAVG